MEIEEEVEGEALLLYLVYCSRESAPFDKAAIDQLVAASARGSCGWQVLLLPRSAQLRRVDDILSRAVRYISTELNLKGATYKPWTEPDSAWYWRRHPHSGHIVTRRTDPAKILSVLTHQSYILDDYIEKYVNDWKVIEAANPAAKVSGPFAIWSKAVPRSRTAFTLDDFLTRLEQYNARTLARR